LDDVGLDEDPEVLEPVGREVEDPPPEPVGREVEDPPPEPVVIDLPSALAWKLLKVWSPEVSGLMAKTIPP